MFEKLSFFTFFLLDLFFVVSGLLYLRSPGEAIWGLLFLIFVWFIMWSVNKVRMYIKEKNNASFIHYYFKYLSTGINTIGNDKQFGPTRFLRIAMIFLSTLGGLIGISTALLLNYDTIIASIASKDVIFRYALLFVYISVYPFVALLLHTVASGSNIMGLFDKFLAFFPLRFTQLFIYLFTFLSPVAWLAIAFLSYIIAKSKTMQKA